MPTKTPVAHRPILAQDSPPTAVVSTPGHAIVPSDARGLVAAVHRSTHGAVVYARRGLLPPLFAVYGGTTSNTLFRGETAPKSPVVSITKTRRRRALVGASNPLLKALGALKNAKKHPILKMAPLNQRNYGSFFWWKGPVVSYTPSYEKGVFCSDWMPTLRALLISQPCRAFEEARRHAAANRFYGSFGCRGPERFLKSIVGAF